MRVRFGRVGIAALVVLLGLTGCGRAGSAPTTAAGGTAHGPAGAATTKPPRSGPSGTLKLTGFYTYDGPFTGQFDCYHSSAGYFELEGQEPYLMDIVMKQMHEGTFVVKPQDPATGFSPDVPGQPFIDVRRLEPADQTDPPTMRQNGGTITLVDGGNSGTLFADYVNVRDESQTVHAELHWQNCPLG